MVSLSLVPYKAAEFLSYVVRYRTQYGSCNEIYLGEGEGSVGASRCCVTPHFLFKNCWMQRSKKLLRYPLRDNIRLIFIHSVCTSW